MNIEIKEQNGNYHGILYGWIDTAEGSQFLEDLKPLMANAGKDIELNCEKLEYICSLGLRGLLQLKKESAAKTHCKRQFLSPGRPPQHPFQAERQNSKRR